MPGLGEEAAVGENVIVAVVGRVLQEDADAVRLITEPGQERRASVECPPDGVSRAEFLQVVERLVEYGHVAALIHRAEKGRRSCSRGPHNARPA